MRLDSGPPLELRRGTGLRPMLPDGLKHPVGKYSATHSMQLGLVAVRFALTISEWYWPRWIAWERGVCHA